MTVGNLFSIERMAVHDGPGIRTVLFLKGCSLRCRWCHNPEGLTAKPVLGLLTGKCSLCGRCAEVCANHRIEAGKHLIDRTRCTVCGRCVDVCPNHALLIYGSPVSPDAAAVLVLEDLDFYRHSGGGVTISGGEPLLQPDFCAELFAILKKENVHCAVETCGNVDWTAFEKVIARTDMFLYDLKAFSPEVHKKCTGETNERILDNLRRLSGSGIPIEIRIPVVPDWNDSPEEITGMAGIIAGLDNVGTVKLLPYHSFGQSKYAAIGEKSTMPPNLQGSKRKLTEIAAVIHRYTDAKIVTGNKVFYPKKTSKRGIQVWI